MYNVCIINRVLTHHCWWFVGGLMADFDWWWILHLYNGEYWRTVNIDEWWILTNGEYWLMKINYFKWVIIWIFGYWLMVNIATTDGEYYGSFKNRKPIGEVGCCESRMAERIHWWTAGWLELCFLEWLQWLQWSPGRSSHPQLLDVVWCSAAVVVVVV